MECFWLSSVLISFKCPQSENAQCFSLFSLRNIICLAKEEMKNMLRCMCISFWCMYKVFIVSVTYSNGKGNDKESCIHLHSNMHRCRSLGQQQCLCKINTLWDVNNSHYDYNVSFLCMGYVNVSVANIKSSITHLLPCWGTVWGRTPEDKMECSTQKELKRWDRHFPLRTNISAVHPARVADPYQVPWTLLHWLKTGPGT